MSYCNYGFFSNLFSFGTKTNSPKSNQNSKEQKPNKSTDKVLSGLDCKNCSLVSPSCKFVKQNKEL